MLAGGDKAVLKSMIKEKLMGRFAKTDIGDISLTFDMRVTRNRESGALTISHADYTKFVLEKHGKGGSAKYVSTPAAGKELSRDQSKGGLHNDSGKQRYQVITSSLIYLAQATRYDILYAVNQIVRAMSKPSNENTGAAKLVLYYLGGTIDYDITYKTEGFAVTVFRVLMGATTRTTAQ